MLKPHGDMVWPFAGFGAVFHVVVSEKSTIALDETAGPWRHLQKKRNKTRICQCSMASAINMRQVTQNDACYIQCDLGGGIRYGTLWYCII